MIMPTTIADLDTPALLLDLDRMESNLHKMADYFAQSKAKLRPHFKTHQVLTLAAQQLHAGAIGITCARLTHAEALVAHGLDNVLIANEIAGDMIRRFLELSHVAPVIVAVDNEQVLAEIARLAAPRAGDLNVIVDLDVGLRRGGVASTEQAIALAKKAVAAGLKLRGLMGYAGSVKIPPGPEKEATARTGLQRLLDTRVALEREGIPVEIVSCGGTTDYSIAAAFPGVTEVQAGSYLLMDSECAPLAPEFSPALTVLSTVVSKTPGERIIADAGLKSLSKGCAMPSIKGLPELRVRALHAEHTLIDLLDSTASPEIGDKIELWVSSLDPTLQLHDRLWGVRHGQIESILSILH